jgi:hypothetical protein
MNKLKEITLKELHDWIEKNKHITWDVTSFNQDTLKKPGHLKGKYIDFSIDTRSMRIFSLRLRGVGTPIDIHINEPGEGTILDALDQKLSESVSKQ